MLRNADAFELTWTGLAFFGMGQWAVLAILVGHDLLVAHRLKFALPLQLQAWTNLALKLGVVAIFAGFAYSGGHLIQAPPIFGQDEAVSRAVLAVRIQGIFTEAVLVFLGFERLIGRFAISRAYETSPRNRRLTDRFGSEMAAKAATTPTIDGSKTLAAEVELTKE